MHYLSKELWAKLNSTDEKIRAEAEAEWKENSVQYNQAFLSMQKSLPHRFVRQFLDRKCFHDYSILGISITRKRRSYSCSVTLSNGSEEIIICFSNVKSLLLDIETFQACIQGILKWGYSEFEHTQSGDIRLSVICDMHNQFQIDFSGVKIQGQDIGS